MTEAPEPDGAIPPAPSEDQLIRERVRELTAQMLSGGRLDTEGVKEVVRQMSGGSLFKPPVHDEQARDAFVATTGALDQALQASAQAVHEALHALVERGHDYSDNDLKNAFAALQKMQQDYVATANHIADATTGNIRRELGDLALHAQRVGADASVRLAQLMSEFATRIGAATRAPVAPRMDAVREVGANMTLLTSGLLAGFADALSQQSGSKKAK